jgi:hypothetical protein
LDDAGGQNKMGGPSGREDDEFKRAGAVDDKASKGTQKEGE